MTLKRTLFLGLINTELKKSLPPPCSYGGKISFVWIGLCIKDHCDCHCYRGKVWCKVSNKIIIRESCFSILFSYSLNSFSPYETCYTREVAMCFHFSRPKHVIYILFSTFWKSMMKGWVLTRVSVKKGNAQTVFHCGHGFKSYSITWLSYRRAGLQDNLLWCLEKVVRGTPGDPHANPTWLLLGKIKSTVGQMAIGLMNRAPVLIPLTLANVTFTLSQCFSTDSVLVPVQPTFHTWGLIIGYPGTACVAFMENTGVDNISFIYRWQMKA